MWQRNWGSGAEIKKKALTEEIFLQLKYNMFSLQIVIFTSLLPVLRKKMHQLFSQKKKSPFPIQPAWLCTGRTSCKMSPLFSPCFYLYLQCRQPMLSREPAWLRFKGRVHKASAGVVMADLFCKVAARGNVSHHGTAPQTSESSSCQDGELSGTACEPRWRQRGVFLGVLTDVFFFFFPGTMTNPRLSSAKKIGIHL